MASATSRKTLLGRVIPRPFPAGLGYGIQATSTTDFGTYEVSRESAGSPTCILQYTCVRDRVGLASFPGSLLPHVQGEPGNEVMVGPGSTLKFGLFYSKKPVTLNLDPRKI